MKIFVTGATGYIGGSVATKLLERGDTVLGLARSDEAAAALKKRGIEPVAADINAYTPIVEVAKRVDAVINAANADNAFVAHALLDGLKGSGKTLIQTSGSSVVGTYDNGEASEDTFDEDTPFTPEPEKAMRVAIDNQVLAAAKDGLRSIVIRPTLIYGRGIGVPRHQRAVAEADRCGEEARRAAPCRARLEHLGPRAHRRRGRSVSGGARQGASPARCSTPRAARRTSSR